ncbi:MAG: PTPA-CTERM sorting domain-containing protein [Leptolyngbya sp. BL-A-14]
MTLNLKAMMTVAALSTTAALVTHVTPASAAALTWNFNANFVDGGTATGSFNYDATSGVLSQFDIKALPGTSSVSKTFFPATTYASGSSTGILKNATNFKLINGDRSLQALFENPLTDAGGTIALVSAFSLEKLTLGDGFGAFRDVANGTVTASATAIPTPALLPGLIGLSMGVLRQKRKSAEAKTLS